MSVSNAGSSFLTPNQLNSAAASGAIQPGQMVLVPASLFASGQVDTTQFQPVYNFDPNSMQGPDPFGQQNTGSPFTLGGQNEPTLPNGNSVQTTTGQNQLSPAFPMVFQMMQMMISMMMQMMTMMQNNIGNTTGNNTNNGNNTNHSTINFNDDASLKARQHQLLGGKSKELDALLKIVDSNDDESPKTEKAKQKISQLWSKMNGDSVSLPEYMLLQDIRHTNAVTGSLKVIQKSMSPNEPEYKQINQRLNKLNAIKSAYIEAAIANEKAISAQ
jgi:hypothetical protein